MSCVPVIVSGDDTAISITLKKNNATFDIPKLSILQVLL